MEILILCGTTLVELCRRRWEFIGDFISRTCSFILYGDIGFYVEQHWRKYTEGDWRHFTLRLLLLSANQLTGSLPDELGKLSNLDRIQVDENQLFGPIPRSFAKMSKAKHIHMNNNSLSGHLESYLNFHFLFICCLIIATYWDIFHHNFLKFQFYSYCKLDTVLDIY